VSMRVVFTREAGKNGELRSLVPDDADVAEVPLTTTEYLSLHTVTASLQRLRHYGRYESFVVTSARVDRYVDVARRALADRADVFAVGPATELVLHRYDLAVTKRSDAGAEALAPFITRSPVLLLGATTMRDELSTALRQAKRKVDEVACYRTVPLTPSATDRATLAAADVVFIGAPSTWTVAAPFVAAGATVVVPGETTAEIVRQTHRNVVVGWDERARRQLDGPTRP